jgi:hypothetical protein
MNREQVLYCFSALTWNLELLCTLSFKSSSSSSSSSALSATDYLASPPADHRSDDMMTQFKNTDDYLAFVQEFLGTFEDYVVALIQAKIVPVANHQVASAAPFATPMGEEERVKRLLGDYPTFVFHTSRALKPGDARRRTAQHIVRNVYLSGKHPALQPLLLEFLGIYRIVQAYTGAELQKVNGALSLRTGLLEWQPIPWPAAIGSAAIPGGAWTSAPHMLDDEPKARTRGLLYKSHLPVSKLPIVKLVIPAVDDDTYDLTQHFHENDIFSFMSGTALPSQLHCHSARTPPCPDAPSNKAGLTLVHCSAGMHRSPAFIVAFMIREHMKAGDPVDAQTGSVRSVDDWCEFIKTRRSVSMPTDVAKAQLNDFLRELRSASASELCPPTACIHAGASVPQEPSAAQHLRQMQSRSPASSSASSPIRSMPSTPPASPPFLGGCSGHSTPAAAPSSPWLTAVFRGQQHHNEVPAVALSSPQ